MRANQPCRIVAISGPTGVGKSTNIKLLVPELRAKGLKVVVTQIRINHLAAGLLSRTMALLAVRHRRDLLPLGALCEDKPAVMRKLFRLWMLLDVASISMKFLFRIYVPKKLGRVVLVEDYIPTSIADHMYLCQKLGFPECGFAFFTNHMLRLMKMGGPTFLVVLDAQLPSLGERQIRRRWKEVETYTSRQRPILKGLTERLSNGRHLFVDTSDLPAIQVRDKIIAELASEF